MEKEIRALIEQAKEGNQEAFAQLYEKYYQSVYIKANALCRNEADAKDMVQDTFYEVQRSLKDLRDCSHFYSWLMMITVSKCHNMFRKKRHMAPLTNDEKLHEIKEERIYMDPQKVIDDQEDQKILHDLVCELPTNYAEIIQLVYFEHCKLIEVATILDIPLGTVKTRVVRARNTLKKKVLLYEKKEQRSLNFHEEALATTITLPFLQQLITKSVQASGQMFSSQALLGTCICALSAVGVVGGTYAVRTYYQEQEQDAHTATIHQVLNIEQVEENTFPKTIYKNQTIQTNRDAYYHCLNFAKDEQTLKGHTKQKIEEFLPVYEALKQQNSPHYQSLKAQGWTQLFETYAYP